MQENHEKNTLTDPVLRLIEYFFAARLMHCHVHLMRDEFGDIKKMPKEHFDDFRIYLSFWLSSLYVVCEGYKDLEIKNQELNALIDKHLDSLRLYRNGTFHFQKQSIKHAQFHDGMAVRLNWAEEIHKKIEIFFHEYIESQSKLT